MRLVLLRHAHALPGEVDGIRPLSAKGRRQVRSLPGAVIKEALKGVKILEHSGLVRSFETAQLLKKHFKVKVPLQKLEGIEPEASAKLTARKLAQSKGHRLIVGHNPHLSCLVGMLLGLKAGSQGIKFRKAGIVALERTAKASTKCFYGQWRLLWMIVPLNDTANS